MNKIKIIGIIGEAGCGKDTLMKECLKRIKNLNPIISYTTRPMRENEKEGIDYYFIDNETFSKKLDDFEIIEATVFNDWCYGVGVNTLSKDKFNIGVFNPEGIEHLLEFQDIELYPIYLAVTPKNRLMRQLKREDNPNVDEIIRRYNTDKKDFKNLSFNYGILENNKPSDLHKAVEKIRAMIRVTKDKEY